MVLGCLAIGRSAASVRVFVLMGWAGQGVVPLENNICFPILVQKLSALHAVVEASATALSGCQIASMAG